MRDPIDILQEKFESNIYLEKFITKEIFKEKIFPNILTMTRAGGVIILILLIYILPWDKKYFACFWIYGFNKLLDVADGYSARKNNLISPMGKWLDRGVDKAEDFVMYKVIMIFSSFLAWCMILTEVYLIFTILIQEKYKIDTSSGQAGKKKTRYRSLATLIFLTILFSRFEHPIAPYTGIFIYGIGQYYGILSIKFHSLKIFQNFQFKKAS